MVALRYSIDMPSPATLTLLRRAEVLEYDAPDDEVVIVDVDGPAIHWFVLRDGRYEAVDRSPLLALDVQEVVEAVDWP